MSTNVWTCACCGEQHSTLPVSFAADYPDPYANLTLAEREARALISSDQCIIDEKDFYLRGCIELPVQGTGDVFMWGVWARVFEKDFDEIQDHWEIDGRERMIGPYKARLANKLSIYPDTLNMPLEIQIRPAGQRPLFIPVSTDHPLSLDHAAGMTPNKAQEYACQLLRSA